MRDNRQLHVADSDTAVRATADALRAMDRDDEDHYANAAIVVEEAAEAFARRHAVTLEMQAWKPHGAVTGVEITDLFADEPGKGNGSRVMEAVASLADAAGLGVYLRPSSPRNSAFYERHGYQKDTQHRGVMVRYSALDPELVAEFGIDLPQAAEPARVPIDAPNGTPEFRKWFGASQIVDDAGEPLVVYHGTRADFTAFDAQHHGANYGHDPEHLQGFYFTPAEWIANSIADNSDMPGTSRTIAVYLSLQNPVVIEMGRRDERIEEIANQLAAAKKRGHDGAIIRNWNDGIAPMEDFDGNPEPLPPQYVAFRPEQIKSAVDNSGLFDASNPDFTDRIASAQAARNFVAMLSVAKAAPLVK